MNRKKKWLAPALAAALCAAFLLGCGAPAEKAVETAPVETTAPAVKEFTSTDGKIAFTMDVPSTGRETAKSSVDVTPMDVTGEMAQSIAKVLLGEDAVFYMPRGERFDRIYTKKEIEEHLAFLEPYRNPAAMEKLYGESAEEYLERLEGAIARYQELLTSAPEAVEDKLCDWAYRLNSSMNESIDTWTVLDGVPFQFSVTVREQLRSGYRTAWISAYADRNVWEYDDVTPMLIDQKLRATPEPDEDQLQQVRAQAEKLLNGLGLGAWTVDGLKYASYEWGKTIRTVNLTAKQVLNGSPIVFNTDVPPVRMAQCEMGFSTEGKLISIELMTPVAVSSTASQVLLPEDALLQTARETLQTWTIEKLWNGNNFWYNYTGESVDCRLEVTALEYGLIRVPNPDIMTYRYVPGLAVRGVKTFYNPETGEELTPFEPQKESTLLVLNALDGTVVY